MYQDNRVNNRQDPIQLIGTEVVKENGHEVEREVSRSPILYAENRGTARAEFYAAQTANRKLDAVFRLNSLDYHGELLLEYDGQQYTIFRSFPVSRDTVDLSCTRRDTR